MTQRCGSFLVSTNSMWTRPLTPATMLNTRSDGHSSTWRWISRACHASRHLWQVEPAKTPRVSCHGSFDLLSNFEINILELCKKNFGFEKSGNTSLLYSSCLVNSFERRWQALENAISQTQEKIEQIKNGPHNKVREHCCFVGNDGCWFTVKNAKRNKREKKFVQETEKSSRSLNAHMGVLDRMRRALLVTDLPDSPEEIWVTLVCLQKIFSGHHNIVEKILVVILRFF